jgi:integrase
MSELQRDRAGRRRSPATMPGFLAGRPPRNKGLRYPADPPKVEEIIAVMRAAGDGAHGRRLRGLIVILWRAGLRVQEALALTEADLDQRRGSLLVRRGKGGRRREVGMDDWGWRELQPWLDLRIDLPVGPLFCVINGATRGRPWATAAARAQLLRTAAAARVRRRFASHQLRHAHAVEMAREGVPLIVIQRQLGHSNLGITSVYLQGIDSGEIIETVHERRPAHDSRQRITAALIPQSPPAARRAKRKRRIVRHRRRVQANAAAPSRQPAAPLHGRRAALCAASVAALGFVDESSGDPCHVVSAPFAGAGRGL